jgi:hypothetical protein
VSARPHLKLIDSATGEIVDSCPTCEEWQRKYQGVLSQLGALRADRQAEAEADPLWPLAMRVFAYHNKVFNHPGAEWTPERFAMVRRRLKAKGGLERCLRAIAGKRTDRWSIEHKKTTFDEVFESAKKFEECLAKAPANWTPPPGMEGTV